MLEAVPHMFKTWLMSPKDTYKPAEALGRIDSKLSCARKTANRWMVTFSLILSVEEPLEASSSAPCFDGIPSIL